MYVIDPQHAPVGCKKIHIYIISIKVVIQANTEQKHPFLLWMASVILLTQCSCGIMCWNVKHGPLDAVWHHAVSASAHKQNRVTLMRTPGHASERFDAAALKFGGHLVGHFIKLESRLPRVHLLWKGLDLSLFNDSWVYSKKDIGSLHSHSAYGGKKSATE